MDPRKLEDYRRATRICIRQVECTLEGHRRGLPRLAKAFRDRTISMIDLDLMERHVEDLLKRPISYTMEPLHKR